MKHWKFLMRLFSFLRFLRDLSFWGICFLLISICILKISIQRLISIAFSSNIPASLVCWFMIISLAVFPLVVLFGFFHDMKKSSFTQALYNCIVFGLRSELAIPYVGFVHRLPENPDKYSALIWGTTKFGRILKTLLWWALFASGIYSFIKMSGLSFNQAIQWLLSEKQLCTVGLFFAIYLGLLLLYTLVDAIKYKNKRRTVQSSSYHEGGTQGQHYYDHHPEHIPASCIACGGPYPECKTSCNLYDR